MNFQTKIPLKKKSHDLIDYASHMLLVGSCFVENIGEKLNYHKFQNTINPFGILFHPLAIESLITRAINEDYYTVSDLFFHNERWHSFEAHSSLSSHSQSELLQQLNRAIDSVNEQIRKSTHIIITLGTAWVYRFVETDRVVANCHKLPQKKFLKELLTVDEIQESLEAIINLVKDVNPKAKFIATVSPVRHIKDGFVENQRSKSHLITAIHNIISLQKRPGNLCYFPSYEIMMDELRDYRFYAEDMIHPNNQAIQYIWEAFKTVWISEEAYTTMDMVATIQKGLAHKPFNALSEQHQQFLNNLKAKQESLQEQFPFMIF